MAASYPVPPPTPDPTKLGNVVTLDCTTDNSHNDAFYSIEANTAGQTGSYEIGEIKQDANGGEFDNGTDKVEVPDIAENTEYSLTGAEQPDYEGNVFIGWTIDIKAIDQVYGAGDEFPDVVDKVKVIDPTTVYAVWGKDTNDDDIADAQQIIITPADITVYTGGDSYAGVVDRNGNLVGNNPRAQLLLYSALRAEREAAAVDQKRWQVCKPGQLHPT